MRKIDATGSAHRRVELSALLVRMVLTTATVLPASGVTGADVEAVKFTQVLRGYKTAEVDWVLERLGAELDGLRAEVEVLRVARQDSPQPGN